MNQITLPVVELKQALPGLTKIIGRKSTLPVLDTIRLTRDHQGNVQLSATDLDTFASYHLITPQPGPVLDVLVPAEQLINAMKSSGKKDSLSLTPDGKDKVKLGYQLGGNPVEQSLNTLPVDEWPMPRRSGTITVWVFSSSAAMGPHMSPVSV